MVYPSSKLVEKFFVGYKQLNFKKRQLILGASLNPSSIYYLKSGFVRQYALSPEGKEVVIHIYRPGAFFPMMSVMNNLENRFDFEALTNCQVILAPKQLFLSFLKKNPQVVYDFCQRLLYGLEGLSRRIEITTFENAHQRVASILIYLTRHFGEKNHQGYLLNYPFTHQEIADFVGISREHTSLEMEKLEQKGLLVYQNRFLFIPSLNKLNKELN